MKRLVFIIIEIFVMMVSSIAEGQNQITRPLKGKTDQTSEINPKGKDREKLKNSGIQVNLSNPDGYVNGYGYVDLGLPSGLKWANCNIGATSPIEDGDRYARGEVIPKKSFTAENYEFVTELEDGTRQFDKYPNPYSDDLDLEHDAANHSRGGTWRIPTADEWEELCDNCRAEGIINNGKKGMLLTSLSNGKCIFLPLTPLMFENGHTAKNSGDYWSSSSGGNTGALSFYFSFSKTYTPGGCSSSNAVLGHAIRAVTQ